MFEYEAVGELCGAGSRAPLLLPRERPLSYLRVGRDDSHSEGLNRALLESRATEFRYRIPLVVAPGEDRLRLSAALESRGASTVFPVLDARQRNERVDLCWLDWVQMKTVERAIGLGFTRSADPVAVAGIEVCPSVSLGGGRERLDRTWQYWNSEWEFADRPAQREEWWRLRPNERRDRQWALRLPRRGTPEARGTFAASLHPEMRKRLGNPWYVVVEHPFRNSRLPVLVIRDRFPAKTSPRACDGREIWRDTIFLDRTARDALGIADGEFCLVHPWRRPRRSVYRRLARDRLVGSRMIAAHVRAPARADLEKPVCRLEKEALEAIGGRSGERVTIEHLKPAPDGRPGHWRRVEVSQRVLPIDARERDARARWEAPQLWDEAASPAAEGPEAPGLEGYVDCAERLGVHPPYPSIYLNYYTRRSRLHGVGLCQPVQVRVGVLGRLTAEASEFAWLVVIALLGAAIAFLESDAWQVVAAVTLAVVTFWLVAFRAIQAIR